MGAGHDWAGEPAASVRSARGVTATLALAGALALLVGLLLAAGCGGPGAVKVGESADGTTVKASVGDVVELSLPENPTTGYEWKMTLGDGLRLQKTDYEPDDKSGELAGSGGVRTWWIAVEAAGQHSVEGVYSRPWESDDPQAGTFTLTVSGE